MKEGPLWAVLAPGELVKRLEGSGCSLRTQQRLVFEAAASSIRRPARHRSAQLNHFAAFSLRLAASPIRPAEWSYGRG